MALQLKIATLAMDVGEIDQEIGLARIAFDGTRHWRDALVALGRLMQRKPHQMENIGIVGIGGEQGL